MFSDPRHKRYARYLGLGAEIAVALSAPIFFGYWLDTRWESSPWFLLGGILLGILLLIGIFSRVIKEISNTDKKTGRE